MQSQNFAIVNCSWLTCIPLYFGTRATLLPLSPIGRIQILTYLIWGILGAAKFDCIIRSCNLFDWFIDEQAGFQLDCGHRLKLGKVDHLFNSYSYYLYFLFPNLVFRADFGFRLRQYLINTYLVPFF